MVVHPDCVQAPWLHPLAQRVWAWVYEHAEPPHVP
jgi:hypothetical protein